MGEVVEVLHAILTGHVLAQVVKHLAVVLQQLQGEVSGGVVLTDVLVGLQVFLDMGDTVFYLMALVDVQMTERLAGSLIDLYDGAEKLLYPRTVLE